MSERIRRPGPVQEAMFAAVEEAEYNLMRQSLPTWQRMKWHETQQENQIALLACWGANLIDLVLYDDGLVEWRLTAGGRAFQNDPAGIYQAIADAGPLSEMPPVVKQAKPEPANPAAGAAGQADDADALGRLIAMMDANGPRIIGIIDNPTLTVDAKLRAVCELDARFYGKTPTEWAKMLGKSRAAVTKTDFWQRDRPKLIADAKERFHDLKPDAELPYWLRDAG